MLRTHCSTSLLKSSFSMKCQILQLGGWIVQHLKKTSSWLHLRGWKKGHSQNIYWPEAVIYFCLILNWEHFTCSLFLPHGICPCGSWHVSMKVSMAAVPCHNDSAKLSFVPYHGQTGKASCSDSLSEDKHTRPKAVFLHDSMITNSFPRKSCRNGKEPSHQGRGEQIWRSLQYLFRICHLRPPTAAAFLSSLTWLWIPCFLLLHFLLFVSSPEGYFYWFLES